jgi:hypothetical protein
MLEDNQSIKVGDNFVEFKLYTMQGNDTNLTNPSWFQIVNYSANGIGFFVWTYTEKDETFTHNLDLASVRVQYPDENDLKNFLVNHFWDKVNLRLADQFIRYESELLGEEIEFKHGNAQEFDRLMDWFILTEPNVTEGIIEVKTAAPEHGDFEVESFGKSPVLLDIQIIGPDASPPCLLKYLYYSERLDDLVYLALKEHYPYGYSYSYMDNNMDRFSGYYKQLKILGYNIQDSLEIPAREKMAARQELSKWLTERGHNPADYGLDWEKIV